MVILGSLVIIAVCGTMTAAMSAAGALASNPIGTVRAARTIAKMARRRRQPSYQFVQQVRVQDVTPKQVTTDRPLLPR